MRGVSTFAFLSLLLSLAGCAPDGSPAAFVSYNLKPDSSCVTMATVAGAIFYPVGHYDVDGQSGDKCDTPYYMNLEVNSYLRASMDMALGRTEPNVLQIHSAEIRLTDINHNTLLFDNGTGTAVVPNPFTVTSSNSLPPSLGVEAQVGIATVQAIPTAYAHIMNNAKFLKANSQILAEVQFFATTLGGEDIDFKPFTYPIDLCSGCMHVCQKRDVFDQMLTPSDVTGKDCPDNSGNDGRVCIDPKC